MADFIPVREGDYIDFLQNLGSKISTRGPALGMTAAAVADVENRVNVYLGLQMDTESAIAAAASKVQERKTAKNDLTTFIRANVRQWKAHTAYTPAIGEDLRMIGSDVSLDVNAYKPVITVKILGGEIRVEFFKRGVDGLNIYCRIKGQLAWKKLSYDSSSPYVDTLPLAVANTPEVREYMARGVIHDQEIGLDSDIASVTFAG